VSIIAPEMLLAFDTSSSACTVALFDSAGACISSADEVIGRGHAERLVPMIAEVLDGRRADRILVGAGPGSFTGIRVAIAAAHGLAIGWNAEIAGMSSLALLAATAATTGEIATAVTGGHGELFVQQFDAATLSNCSELRNVTPTDAARFISAELVVGSGAELLVAARGWGEARELWPSAADALRLAERMRTLAAKPIYARAADARVREAA
jgi:tRNA threonylcarbamoyladenosine biosynthesis protein TsaB